MHEAKLKFQRSRLNAGGVVTPVRLYLTADRKKVVGEGKDAAFLLAAAGSEVSKADIERYGLQPIIDEANKAADDAKASAEAEAKAQEEAKRKADEEAKKKAADEAKKPKPGAPKN